MEIRMLGPLEVVAHDDVVAVGGARIRRLLAALLLADGAVVSIESLADAIWPDQQAPDGSRRTVMSYVSRLRRALGVDLIEQTGSGYRLRSDMAVIDMSTFELAVEAGQQAGRSGDAGRAVSMFDQARELWRGEPLGEFAGEHWVEPDRVRLVGLYRQAVEGRLEAKLALGDHTEVLAELEREDAEDPGRERVAYLHMLALYRCGRQIEALRRFEALRSQLAELGLEPTTEVQELELQILNHDQGLLQTSPAPGTILRGYELGTPIGEGSFGTIYQATQPAVGREVAIKVIRAEFANDPDFIRRFETEAQLVAHLEHPHIVPLYDYWREPGGAYLVMRLLRGGNAEDRLVSEGPLPVATVVTIIDHIGGALAVAHARGVIHRDVKPANILFDESGIAYLADFGIAVRDERRDDGHGLRSAGSPLYASPEQVRGEEVTASSDVYSLGVAAFELLVGKTAFSADSVQALLDEKLRASVPSLRHSRPDLPPALDAVLGRATAVKRTDRFPDMGEFVLAFRAAAASTAEAVMTGEPEIVAVERPRAAASRTLVKLELATLNPYKGLRAFQESDAQDFFGRTQLVDELIDRVRTRRLVAVVGASGSGKSSVVRAGLLPALAEDHLFTVTIVPGAHPLEELEAGLLRIASSEVPGLLDQLRSEDRGLIRAVRRVLPPDGSELVLVIDQFEEIFTVAAEHDRQRFLDALVAAIEDDSSRIRVVATIRADFYDRPLRHRAFGALLQDHAVHVLAMSPDELAAAIEGPARRLGVSFEDGLVAAVTSEVGEHSGALPLLQYALTELYEHRRGSELTLAEYREVGGVTAALGRRAEELFEALGPDDRAGARRLFTRLVTPGEGVEDTRRRALRSELVNVDEDVVDVFGRHRLLSFDRDPATRAPTVEVAHEALIREWHRLREWLDEDRSGLRLLRHLTTSTAGWLGADRDPAELYRGSRLDTTQEWAVHHADDLTADESAFLGAGLELRRAEELATAERAALREEQNRRLRRSLVGVGLLAIAAVIAGTFAFQQSGEAQERADEAAQARAAAETRRLISDASQLAPTNLRVSLLLAAEAHHRDPGSDSLGAIQIALTESSDLMGFLASDLQFTDVAFSSEGQIVGVHSGGVAVLSPSGGDRRDLAAPGARLLTTCPVVNVAAVADSSSTVRIVDLDTGELVVPPLAQAAAVTAMAFSADGTRFAIGDHSGSIQIYDDTFDLLGRIEAHTDATRLLDPEDLPEGVPPPVAHEPLSFGLGVVDLALSADGSRLASVGGFSVRAWDTTTLEPLLDMATTRLRTDGDEVAAAPTGVGFVRKGGHEVIASSERGSIQLWNGTGQEFERVIFGGADALRGWVTSARVAFGDDFIVAVSGDGRVRTIDLVTGEAEELEARLEGDLVVALDEVGARITLAGSDGAVLMSLIGTGLISRSFEGGEHNEWSVSNDGTVVVGTTNDTEPSIAYVLTDGLYEPVEMVGAEIDFVLTGQPHAIGIDFETQLSRERDPSTLEPFGPRYGPHSAFIHAVSPDQRLIAMGTGGPFDPATTLIYNRESGELVAELDEYDDGVRQQMRGLAFNPDGSRLVVTTNDGSSLVYDTATWVPLEPPLSAGEGAVAMAQYTPDGRYLVTANASGSITIRDAESFQPTGLPILGNAGSSRGFSAGPMFSADSQWMVTTMDGDARLWDLDARQLIGRPFPNDGLWVINASQNARHVVTARDGRVVVWNLEVDRWLEIACQAVGRNLTMQEWEQYGPAGEPYRATCVQWPSLETNDNQGGDHD